MALNKHNGSVSGPRVVDRLSRKSTRAAAGRETHLRTANKDDITRNNITFLRIMFHAIQKEEEVLLVL